MTRRYNDGPGRRPSVSIDEYTKHLLSITPSAKQCVVVAPDGRLLREYVTDPGRAEMDAERDNLGRDGNMLVDSDGVVYRTWEMADDGWVA